MVRGIQPIHQRGEVSLTNALRSMRRRPLKKSTAVAIDDARGANVTQQLGM